MEVPYAGGPTTQVTKVTTMNSSTAGSEAAAAKATTTNEIRGHPFQVP